jgi:hypothetical protein
MRERYSIVSRNFICKVDDEYESEWRDLRLSFSLKQAKAYEPVSDHLFLHLSGQLIFSKIIFD